jgi:hypothetical protein
MSNYRRLISYIYAYEGGIKGKNIGFAKIETRGIQCKITVSVKRIYVGGNDIGVYLLAGEQEIYLGNIFIRGGSGEFRTVVSASDIEHSGITVEQCFGLTIHDVKNTWRSYTTIWEDAVAHAAEVELKNASPTDQNTDRSAISEEQIKKAVREIEEEFPLQSSEATEDKEPSPVQTITDEQEEESLQTEAVKAEDDSSAPDPEIDSLDPELEEASIEAENEEDTLEFETEKESLVTEAEKDFSNVENEEASLEDGEDFLQGEIDKDSFLADNKEAVKAVLEGDSSEKSGEISRLFEVHQQVTMPGMTGPTGMQPATSSGMTGPTGTPSQPMPTITGPMPITRPTPTGPVPITNPSMIGPIPGTRPTMTGPMPATMTGPASGTRQGSTTGPTIPGPTITGPTAGWDQGVPPFNTGPVPGSRPSMTGPMPGWWQTPMPSSTGPTPGVPQMNRPISSNPVPSPTGPMSQEWKKPGQEDKEDNLQENKTGQVNAEAVAAKKISDEEPVVPGKTLLYRADAVIKEAPENQVETPKLGNPDELERLRQNEDQDENPHTIVWDKLRREHTRILAFDYEDGCEILTIKPQDIGLLPRDAWVFGNNSFLLHGYYNYRYLILAKLINPNGTPRYLLGIPGHYYSNERYMASMFGFPNFVLSKEQPVEDGRFGFWYTDVKLGG